MHSQTRFRINSPKVILETFDDEVVIVNLDSGNYYSLDKVGAEIWGSLEQGATTSEITTTLGYRYQGDPQTIAQAVARFLDELQQEEILLPLTELRNEAAMQGSSTLAENNLTSKRPFEIPVLQKYCPSLNLIERLWGHLKRTVLANVLYTRFQDLVAAFRKGARRVAGNRERMSFMFTHEEPEQHSPHQMQKLAA